MSSVTRPKTKNWYRVQVIAIAAPFLVLASVVWASSGAMLEPNTEEAARMQNRQESSLVAKCMLPAIVAVSVACPCLFMVVSASRRWAAWLAPGVCVACVAILTVAIVMLRDGAGRTMVASAEPRDWFVVFAIPLAITLLITVLGAWGVSRIESTVASP